MPSLPIPATAAKSAVLAITAIAVSGAGCKRQPEKHVENAPPQAQAEPMADEVLPSIPGLDTSTFDGAARDIMAKADPSTDEGEWSSEALSAESSIQLKALAKLFSSASPTETELARFVADGFVGKWEDRTISVAKPPTLPSSSENGKAVPFFRAAMAAHGDAGETRVALKTVRFDGASDSSFSTKALFQSSSPGIQQNGEWLCRWSREAPPRLQELVVAELQLVKSDQRFVDVTGSVLGAVPSAREQLTIGAGHWQGRIQKHFFIDSTGHQGIAVGDADGDGMDDLYFAQQGGLPNKLYVQNPDGTLRDASAEAGLDWMELTHGALFVDLDNDGDQDLVLSQVGGLVLMENLGGLRFEGRFVKGAASGHFSLAAADFDADSDLDLYVCGNGRASAAEFADGARASVPIPYHDSRNGGKNMLLRNDGDWNFSDATADVGLDQNNDRHSFAASWEDFDNDGDLDLYVANDFGRNNLYRNEGGAFVDIAATAGVEDMSAGMAVTWADFDRDGLMDIYVSNMFSAAGNRVTYQRQFRADGDPATRAGFQRHARGNSLFRNRGDGSFEDVSIAAGVTMGRWAWGAKFADLNNDGWEDLYVANGYISAEEDDDL